MLVDDDERPDACGAHVCRSLGEAGGGRDGIRVADDAVLLALDDLDLAHLRADVAAAEPAVDDPDPALFGHGDGHLGARDRIHVGRDDRSLECEVSRKAGREVDGGGITSLDNAVLRGEEEVVEGAASDEIEEIRHAHRVLRLPSIAEHTEAPSYRENNRSSRCLSGSWFPVPKSCDRSLASNWARATVAVGQNDSNDNGTDGALEQ